MQESRPIQTLQDIKELLQSFDKRRNEIEELSKEVMPAEVEKPEMLPMPAKGEPQEVPKASALPYIILVLSLLMAGGIWYYGKYVLYTDFLMYGIGFVAVGFLFFFLLFFSNRRAIKKVTTANENLSADHKKACEEAMAENDRRKEEYAAAVEKAKADAAEANQLNKIKIDQANASMDRLEKTYMEKYARMIPPSCCDIESLDYMIDLLKKGTVRTIREATLYVQAEREYQARNNNGAE